MSVDYMMDDPLQIFTPGIDTPISTRTNPTHVKLNEFDLSRYNIVVQSIYPTALRPHSAKPVLERKMQNVNGLIVDTISVPKAAARQITIECVMLADTLNEFWINFKKQAPYGRRIKNAFNLILQEI